MENIVHINGVADINDIKNVYKKYGDQIVSVQPCPYSDYDPEKKTGKINPHVTKFTLRDGQHVSVFHIKPIYYETLNGQWRPLYEITHGYGNTWVDFKAGWHEKMHSRYMAWLIKRADILKGKINIPTPYETPITVEQKPLTTV